ncbi:hypothetical protein SAY87_013981 [Trapa incisa]|uniref:Uncharacterized protein n=1 Tax=Trapa incisa TaxID=236973 RepID=A0AAN7GJD9_9MYRT|nr:hypothetical protein SAY87_013981 [Trapa incisa]
MASLVLLLSELLRPSSSTLAFLSSSQPFPSPSTTFPASTASLNRWSLSTRPARRSGEEAEAPVNVVEDLQEPKVCVDLVWP